MWKEVQSSITDVNIKDYISMFYFYSPALVSLEQLQDLPTSMPQIFEIMLQLMSTATEAKHPILHKAYYSKVHV